MNKGFFDGACRGNPGMIGMGAVIYFDADNSHEEFKLCFMEDRGTNNEAEYKALIALLNRAIELNIADLHIYGDSKLVIEQMNGNWKVKQPNIKVLHRAASKLISKFNTVTFNHILRKANNIADKLANKALDEKITFAKYKDKALDKEIDNEFIFDDFDLNLTILIEECAEAMQAACKVKRFGKTSKNPDVIDSLSNIRQLEKELGHITAMIDCLIKCGAIREKGIQHHTRSKLVKLKNYYK